MSIQFKYFALGYMIASIICLATIAARETWLKYHPYPKAQESDAIISGYNCVQLPNNKWACHP